MAIAVKDEAIYPVMKGRTTERVGLFKDLAKEIEYYFVYALISPNSIFTILLPILE